MRRVLALQQYTFVSEKNIKQNTNDEIFLKINFNTKSFGATANYL